MYMCVCVCVCVCTCMYVLAVDIYAMYYHLKSYTLWSVGHKLRVGYILLHIMYEIVYLVYTFCTGKHSVVRYVL